MKKPSTLRALVFVAGLLALGGNAFAQFSYAGCADVVASDFAIDTLVSNSTNSTVTEPLKMAFDKDAQGNVDVYFTQRYGRVQKYSGAAKTTVTIANFAYPADSVSTGSFTMGLHGIALDPGFKTNGWVYLYAAVGTNTTLGVTWRVTRYKLTGTTLDITSAKTIWRTTSSSYGQHMGGSLRFDKDGNLWIAVADNGGATTPSTFTNTNLYEASNTNSFFGKILRIKPKPLADAGTPPAPGVGSTYDVPLGNLFPSGTAQTLPEIYVMGNRNPYTLTIDSVRKGIAWGEVGPDNFSNGSTNPAQQTEEFNLTTTPGYFGWPYWAGNQINLPTQALPSGSTPAAPINNHSTNTGLTNLPPARAATIPYGKDCAVTGPVYYYDPNLNSGVKFPPHFDGKWFLGEFNKNWIDAVALNDSGTQVLGRKKMWSKTTTSGYLATLPFINSMLELEMGPDGALYAVNYAGYRTTTATTGLFRIRYQGTCRPGVSSITLSRPTPRMDARVRGGWLEVLSSGRHTAEIRDLSGKLVWSRRGEGQARYDLHAVGVLNGMHLLTVEGPAGRFSRKLMP